MGEAFGVASSAVSIISLGIQIAQGILWYYGAWKDRDDDISNMCASLNNLTESLKALRETLKPPALFSEVVKDCVEKSIIAFNRTLNKLEDELKKVKDTEPPKPGARSTIRRHVRRALYPFKEATLGKIQGAVSEARSSLTLALDVLKLNDISCIRHQINTIVRWKEDEETGKIVEWLSPLNSWLKQEDVSKQRQAGIGQWLLDDSDFLEWAKGNRECLWCRGMPGVGKTVLASAVIEFLEKDLPIPDTGLAFFYCNYKERPSQSIEYFAGTIVRQLVEQRSVIPEEVRTLYGKYRGKGTRLGCAEYLELLQSLARGCLEVYIVIDALDECINKDEESIWSGLLTKLKASIPNLHLLCTSRHISDIRGSLAGATQIEIRASDADIKAYVLDQIGSKDRLLGFCRDDATLQDEILNVVGLKAEGMFLAAQLHVESLAKKQNLRAVRKTLSELPKKLDDIYHEAMKRIKQQSADDSGLALRALSWIVYAVRPLQLIEIQHAMAVDDLESGDRSISNDCLTPQNIIVNVCAGLIKIDEKSNVIRLVHYTTQEYFERSGSDHIPHAQRNIGVTCLKYLSLDLFSEGYCHTDELYEYRLKENPLLNYAARNWVNHIREENGQDVQDLAVQFLLDDSKVSCASQAMLTEKYFWDRGYSQHFPKDFQGVHYAAYFGLKGAMTKLLFENPKLDADLKGGDGRTPLSWAAEKGHEGVVELLLEKAVDVDCKDNDGRTPLSWAAGKGHEGVVRLLLEKAVDVDYKDSHGFTPLCYAAENGHKGMVELLLEKAVDVDSKGYFGRTPLSWAARKGHERVAELLLEKAVDVDSGDNYGQTPLSHAAENGHEGVVKLLLEKAVDVDSKDNDGRMPLSHAAEKGHEGVMELLLLEKAVDVDSKDSYGLTPLSHAAWNGHEGVVKLLLEKAVDVDSKGNRGFTPLCYAAENGHEGVVKLLLEKAVDVDSKGNDGQTPLSYAAGNGYEGVVKLLLEKAVDVDSKDDDGLTPLSYAAGSGYEGVVKLLLEKAVDLDYKDSHGFTPLCYAAENGHKEVVKLLLEKGAKKSK